MRAQISIVGGDVLCQLDDEPSGEVRLPLAREVLVSWSVRYDDSLRDDNRSALVALGSDIVAWLDASGWASRWVRGGIGPRILEVSVDDPDSPEAGALLDVPWELLAPAGEFLALDDVQPFVVVRRIGDRARAEPAEVFHRDLVVLFMAASPAGVPPLNFELEEAALVQPAMQVLVEESGCAQFLKERIASEGPFEALHLSCHGMMEAGRGPELLLETATGGTAPAGPAAIVDALGERPAPLVFVSACYSSATPGSANDSRPKGFEPFVRALVRAGVANVVGWDGSVYDRDAIEFAEKFYGELAAFRSVPYAAAVARGALLRRNRDDPKSGRHWHLVRVYAGPAGGGAICKEDKPRHALRPQAGYTAFLDVKNRRVPVAGTQQFVGRRREVKGILRAFRSGDHAGVLLHGMANLGKSSLASRVASRMPGHKTVVVLERYDAVTVFDQLVSELPPAERGAYVRNWREKVAKDAWQLGDALEQMIDGPLVDCPVLLVIDELERILETPAQGHRRTPISSAPGRPGVYRDALAAILRAFWSARTATSRLLLLSRYVFTLPGSDGVDLADHLIHVPLPSMDLGQRRKQWLAALRTAQDSAPVEAALVEKVISAGSGNPGLQDLLIGNLLNGRRTLAEQAMAGIESFKATGRVPSDNGAVKEFFEHMSFDVYDGALTDPARKQLSAATVFSEGLLVPLVALEAVGKAAGVSDSAAAIGHLRELGLLDAVDERAAANPLARQLGRPALTDDDRLRLATAAIEACAAVCRDEHVAFPHDIAVEAGRLARLGQVSADILDSAARAVTRVPSYTHVPVREFSRPPSPPELEERPPVEPRPETDIPGEGPHRANWTAPLKWTAGIVLLTGGVLGIVHWHGSWTVLLPRPVACAHEPCILVTGRVVDDHSGAGISDVTVLPEGYDVRTDTDVQGRLTINLEQVRLGDLVHFRLIHPQYQSVVVDAFLTPRSLTLPTISLRRLREDTAFPEASAETPP